MSTPRAIDASPVSGRHAVSTALRVTVRAVADETDQDAALMRAIALHADRVAFTAVFQRYAPKVKAFLLARGAPRSTADELVQDVLLTVWRKAALYDPAKGALGTWMFTVARNAMLNHTRAAVRRPLDAEVPDRAELPDDGPDGERRLIDLERQRAIARSLAALPAEQRDVVVGAYWNGQTLQECAAVRKIPLGTAKTRARLALARLRELLNERSGE
jgi:RNA polymerase sigma-70 factor, ECF subfamily